MVGRFEAEGDCDKLLYTPLDEKLRFRHSRVYGLEFEGDQARAEAFVRQVLVDPVSQDVRFGDDGPAFPGAAFHLDYGMKPGALDLEKEAVLRYFSELDDPGFSDLKLTITQRIYVFGKAAASAPDRFVRDIVNPAIHVWNVCDRRESA